MARCGLGFGGVEEDRMGRSHPRQQGRLVSVGMETDGGR